MSRDKGASPSLKCESKPFLGSPFSTSCFPCPCRGKTYNPAAVALRSNNAFAPFSFIINILLRFSIAFKKRYNALWGVFMVIAVKRPAGWPQNVALPRKRQPSTHSGIPQPATIGSAWRKCPSCRPSSVSGAPWCRFRSATTAPA